MFIIVSLPAALALLAVSYLWWIILPLTLVCLLYGAFWGAGIGIAVGWQWLNDPKRRSYAQAALLAVAIAWVVDVNVPDGGTYVGYAFIGLCLGTVVVLVFNIFRDYTKRDWLTLVGISAAFGLLMFWAAQQPPPAQVAVIRPAPASIFDPPPSGTIVPTVPVVPAPAPRPRRLAVDEMFRPPQPPPLAFDIDDTSGAWQPMKAASARAEWLLHAFHQTAGVSEP